MYKFNIEEKSHRLLFDDLYSRWLKTETPVEWINRVITKDPTLGILFDLDKFKIMNLCIYNIITDKSDLAALIQVMETVGSSTAKEKFEKEALEYISNLRALDNRLKKILFVTTMGNLKRFTKKHDFSLDKIILSKEIKIQTLTLTE